eukprot:m.27601 g.27601  ORF g.27601 m.27601 type:complete len:470 (-) comp15773_c0_seq1:470-1879(-)
MFRRLIFSNKVSSWGQRSSISIVNRGTCTTPIVKQGAEAAFAQSDSDPNPPRTHTSTSTWTDERKYAKIRLPVNEATTLPGQIYHDVEVQKLEQERLWKASWVATTEISHLANSGDVVPVTVGGQSIILTNDRGTIRAFQNVCRHRGAQLVGEKCTRRKTILCPYHRWGYALDGRLMGTPSWDTDEMGKTVPEKIREKFKTNHVKDFNKKEMGLFPVRMDTALGMVFVNFDEQAPPLLEWLGDVVTLLEDHPFQSQQITATVHTKQYNVKANWKVMIENFLEYYHLPAVHPALCMVSGVDEHDRAQGTGMYMAFKTDPLTKGGTALDVGRMPPAPGLKERDQNTAYHVCIFPNVFFSVYPDNIFRVILQPGATPGETIEHATLLSNVDALAMENSEELLKETWLFHDNVNMEDIQICEKVHIGTSAASYQGGRFSYRFEETLHRFQNMVADKLVGGQHKYRIPKGDDAV